MTTKRNFINNTERLFLYENNKLSEDERKIIETDFLLNPSMQLEYKIYLETNNFIGRRNRFLKKILKKGKIKPL